MKLSLSLLLLLSGCNFYEGAVQKAREALNQSAPVLPDDAPAVYKVVPPPALENDKVVQFGPKDRLIALVEQFRNSPDDSLLQITVDEFTKQKQLFGATQDPALVTVLNGLIPLVQSKNKNTLQLLVQLHALLVGENQTFLRTILARGFDFAPALTVNFLIKFEQDKLCSMVSATPVEVTKEERYAFLEERLNALAPARLLTGQTPVYTPYIDTCLSQLRLEMAKESPPPEAVLPSPAVDSPTTDTSATPTTPSPQAP